MLLQASTASSRDSGSPRRPSCSSESRTSAAPTSWRFLASFLRRVLLIKSPSSMRSQGPFARGSLPVSAPMPDHPVASLPLTQDAMAEVARLSLEYSRKKGASDAEGEVSAAVGQSVTVRRGEVETVEYNRDKGLGITVYFGQRRGNASTSDL